MSIELSLSGPVATIRLNRPQKLNALTDAMWLQLADHLDRCEQDDAIRVIILRGEGRAFCAGADISGEDRVIERKPGIAGTVQAMEFYDAVVRRIYHMPKPTIAAVQGATVGIAWTMALCCDWVLAAEDAKFRPAFLNLAKVPEAGFQFLVTRLIGQMKARDIVYRSQLLSGAQAAELGLATRVVANDALIAEAEQLAQEVASLAPLSFKLTKQLFHKDSGDFDGFLQAELNAISIAANTDDAREGMAAFREKRAANFGGT